MGDPIDYTATKAIIFIASCTDFSSYIFEEKIVSFISSLLLPFLPPKYSALWNIFETMPIGAPFDKLAFNLSR